jgi:hypothetical protein
VHHLLVRGNHAKEGKEITPGTPAILNIVGGSSQTATKAASASFDSDGAEVSKLNSSRRRLALAYWLTSSNNPIVARVLVNRIWHYHFGQGLAGTLENLGQSGERPVCPELLDWLASELIRSGWSMKHLHRLILKSATWRQAFDPLKIDSTMAHSKPRRLDAESLRDAMLTVSGELDFTSSGPYVPTKTDAPGQVIIDEKQTGAYRRSIYLQQRRTTPVNFLSTFDGPSYNPVCIQRVSSTVALQSLSLLNSEFVHLRARGFANRILARADLSAREVAKNEASGAKIKSALRFAFEAAYGRPPSHEELFAAKDFLREQNVIYKEQPDIAVRVWTDLCQMLLASNAFLYVD